jgi:hypothetical protein
MSEALAHIKRRREWLVQRAAEQRRTLDLLYRTYEKPMETGARVFGYLKFFKSPLVLTGVGALLMRTRWRKFSGLPRWAWRGWKLFQVGRIVALSRAGRL